MCYKMMPPKLRKYILYIVHIFRHIYMELCLVFWVLMPIIKYHALKWHYTMTMSLKLPGTILSLVKCVFLKIDKSNTDIIFDGEKLFSEALKTTLI